MVTEYQTKSLSQKIIDRQNQVETARNPYDDRFAAIVDFCDPGLTAWNTEYDTEGKFRGTKIYEGTPAWALRVMADGWLGSTVGESLQWLKYLFPDKYLRENDDISRWMQDLEDAMYASYRKSQLYSALSPFARAALSVGSPVIMPYDDVKHKRISCDVPHPKENYHGPYESYHRKYKITVIDAVKAFMGGKVPDDTTDSVLSNALLSDYNNGRHGKRHEFIRAIYQQDDPILGGQPVRMRNKPWMEFYVEVGADPQQKEKEPIKVGGYFTKPHIRWDYELNTDEIYARTPAWNAMQDIRSGQELEKQKLEAGQRSLHPPMWVQRKYKRQIQRLRPGGAMYYGTSAEADSIPKPIQEGINFQVGEEVIRSAKNSIERWFHTEFFQLIGRLTKENTGSWPTATQILRVEGEQARQLSPKIGRFTHVLREIDTRFFDIEQRKGNLPIPPDIVLEYMAEMQQQGETELDLQVEFVGPLAVIQQRAETLGRTEEGLSVIERYLGLDDMLRHKVRLDVALEKDLENVRWPQDAIVSEDEYSEVLAAIAQKEEEAVQAERLAAAADAVPKISKKVEEGSPLEAVANV